MGSCSWAEVWSWRLEVAEYEDEWVEDGHLVLETVKVRWVGQVLRLRMALERLDLPGSFLYGYRFGV